MMSLLSQSSSYIWSGIVSIPQYWSKLSFFMKGLSAVGLIGTCGFGLKKLSNKVMQVYANYKIAQQEKVRQSQLNEQRMNAGYCICPCNCGNKEKIERLAKQQLSLETPKEKPKDDEETDEYSSSSSSSSSSSTSSLRSSHVSTGLSQTSPSVFSSSHFSTSTHDVTMVGTKAPEEEKESVKKKNHG